MHEHFRSYTSVYSKARAKIEIKKQANDYSQLVLLHQNGLLERWAIVRFVSHQCEFFSTPAFEFDCGHTGSMPGAAGQVNNDNPD